MKNSEKWAAESRIFKVGEPASHTGVYRQIHRGKHAPYAEPVTVDREEVLGGCKVCGDNVEYIILQFGRPHGHKRTVAVDGLKPDPDSEN